MALTKISTGMLKQDAASSDLNIDAGTLYLDVSNNRVGVANTSPSQALDVTGYGKFTSSDGSPRLYLTGSSKSYFFTNTSGGLFGIYDDTNSAYRLVISGNAVGIGTTSPETNLHIEDGSSYSLIRLVASTASVAGIDFGDADDRDIGRVRYNNSDDSMVFHTNAAEQMRIDSSGRVGIGVTSVSSSLHVYHATDNNLARFQSGDATAHIQFKDSNTTYIPSLGAIGDDLTFSVGNGAPERVRINTSGNVGIGVTSPGSRLHVYHASTDTIANFESGDTGVAVNFTASDNSMQIATSSTDGILKNNGSGALRLFNNGSERMRIDSSGDLIIGGTSSGANDAVSISNTGYIQAIIDGDTAAYFNRRTSDGEIIRVQKDGSTVGSIGSNSARFYIHNNYGSGSGLRFDNAEIRPSDSSGNGEDATTDLGASAARFKDLYLSGTANTGGLTSVGDAAITGSSSGSTVLTLTSNALVDTPLMVFQRIGGAVAGKLAYEDNNTAISFGTTTAHELKFLTSNTERMQIDSSGNLYVGKTNNTLSNDGTIIRAGGEILVTNTSDIVANFNRTGTDGAIATFYKDGSSTVGSIGTLNSALTIGTGDTGVQFNADTNAILPHNITTGTNVDASIDIGRSSGGTNRRFKDLYLSGTVNAASLNIDGGTIKLDGNSPVGGTNNVALGNQAGQSMTTASTNTLIGAAAGDSLTTGSSNVALGYGTLTTDTAGQWNVAIGRDALQQQNFTAAQNTYNTAVGGNAMKANTTGTANTAVGGLALDANTTANNNTAVGYSALTANTTGANNTASGRSALQINATGSYNSAFGMYALLNNTTSNNTAVGYAALQENTTASNNTAVGYQALYSTTTGGFSTAVGGSALKLSTGLYNDAFGYVALTANTTGTNNNAFGGGALEFNTTGSYNTAFGRTALLSNTTASGNTAIGYEAGKDITTGTGMTAVGYKAAENTTGNNTTALGYSALQANTSGGQNTAVGTLALTSNTTASYNTAVGHLAGYSNTTGAEVTFVGQQAGYSNSTGSYNTGIGVNALYTNTTGVRNTAVGRSALSSNAQGNYNVAVGMYALESNVDASYNTAVGYQALDANTTGTNNIGIGYSALGSNTGGFRNVAIGSNSGALATNTTGNDNIAIGADALRDSLDSDNNVAVGYRSLLSSTSANNVAIGKDAGFTVTSGGNNTYIGFGSGPNSSGGTGSQNTMVGYLSGNQMSTGAKNTIVGAYNGNQNGLDIRTSNNNVILSDGDGNIRFHTNSSGNTGIGGIVNSSYKLHVGGAINIDATTEDSSITGGLVTRTPAYSEYHFSVGGNQSHTIEMTCGSYFMAVVEYMSFQTNSGGDPTEGIQEYHRGVWANNHTTHTWNEFDSSGSTSAVTNSISAGQNTTSNSGKLTIGITYGSGSYSGSTIVVKVYFGDEGFAISRS